MDHGVQAIISPESDNLSILITGRSGSGKTYALKEIERNLIQDNGIVLVLNYHGSHTNIKGEKNVRWINASTDGIPMTMLTPLPKQDNTYEDIEDIAASIVDIFCNVHSLQVQQKKILCKAIKLAIQENQQGCFNEIAAIGEALHKISGETAEIVYEHFYMLFKKGRMFKGQKIIEKGYITVIDFDSYDEITQAILIELLLSCLWRYFSLKGQDAEDTLFIVLDEFQTLNIHKNSILSKFLREGRKYHLALILATQTFHNFEKESQILLQQAATRIYFHPVQNEIKYIVKNAIVKDKEDFKNLLLKLGKGECFTTGRFKVGTETIDKTIFMKF